MIQTLQPTFVLVHGAGMGAWCWFKVLAELKQQRFDAVAIDLASAGIHPADANSVTTIDQLAQPLLDFVANFSGQKNVSPLLLLRTEEAFVNRKMDCSCFISTECRENRVG